MASGAVHTRRTCLKAPHRASWIDAEFAQLDKHQSYGMYGAPVPRKAVPSSARIVRLIWQYSQKGNCIFKTRKCMNGKQLTRMGLTFEHTYSACMEPHCLRMVVAIAAIFGFLIEDGDVVNAYAHADAEGPTIYLVVEDVFQSWYQARFRVTLPLGSCVPLLKAMQGHPEAGNLWSKHFDASCAAPLGLVPAFTKPTMYRRDDTLYSGPTLMLRQVDDILCGASATSDRDAVLNGIASRVTFVRSKALTTLFYATDIEQCAQYIKVYASSYIGSCLAKLGWESTVSDSPLMAPLTPAVLKTLRASVGPLDPSVQLSLQKQFGFPYRTLTGMLIFAVQIGRFDINPAVSILCKFNERPSNVHLQAAKNFMRYLRATRSRGLIYWLPTGRERSDLPRGDSIPTRPERAIADRFPPDLPLLEPVCYVNASYGGLLVIGEHRSVTGIIICLGGTAIFAKTRIQRTTALSSTEAEIIAGCDAGKDIKYFRQLFVDLGFPITKPTLMAKDNAGTILIANHRRPSGRTRHLDIQYFATQEWVQRGLVFFFKIDGTANPSDAMSKVLYRILHRRHFDRIMGYNGSTHATHHEFLPNPDDNSDHV
jgi:hypothetical protein